MFGCVYWVLDLECELSAPRGKKTSLGSRKTGKAEGPVNPNGPEALGAGKGSCSISGGTLTSPTIGPLSFVSISWVVWGVGVICMVWVQCFMIIIVRSPIMNKRIMTANTMIT